MKNQACLATPAELLKLIFVGCKFADGVFIVWDLQYNLF